MAESEKEQEGHRGFTRAMQNDERRRSLLVAAYQLIAEKGFEHLRTRDIAARAGVNIATLHYHFATKEDLIDGVVEYLLLQFRTPLTAVSDNEDTSPWGQIQSMFFMLQYRLEHTPELFVVLSEFVLRSLRSSSIHPALHKLDSSWYGFLKQVIIDGVEQGQFRNDIDPGQIASELIIVIKGTIFHRMSSTHALNFNEVQADIGRLLLH